MRFSKPQITTTLLVGAAAIVLRELAVQLAADSIESHLWLLGSFVAWRWSSVVIGLTAVGASLIAWDYVDRRRPSAGSTRPIALASPGEEIVLLEPTDKASVIRTFRIRGLARTFEGNLVVEDLTAKGSWNPVAVTTAGMLDGHSQFSLDITLAPGPHTLRIGSSTGRGEVLGVEISVLVEDRPRILGQGMMHLEVWGLEREGSYHRVPIDVVELLKGIIEYDGVHMRAPQDFMNTERFVGRPSYAVEENASELGLAIKYMDPAGNWSTEVAIKGAALLAAYKEWMGSSRVAQRAPST
jgi:hypothetical protein